MVVLRCIIDNLHGEVITWGLSPPVFITFTGLHYREGQWYEALLFLWCALGYDMLVDDIYGLRPRQSSPLFSDDTFKCISRMKGLEFHSAFHWNVFWWSYPQKSNVRWWLGADQATNHYLKQWWLDYRRIDALIGINDLSHYQDLIGTISLHALWNQHKKHYSVVIRSVMASQIKSPTIVCSTVYTGAEERKKKVRVTGLCAGNSKCQWHGKCFHLMKNIFEVTDTSHQNANS